MAFIPSDETPSNIYNLWRGFAHEAVPGESHAGFLEHVRENICHGSEEHYHYLIGWMATAVQKPANPGRPALPRSWRA